METSIVEVVRSRMLACGMSQAALAKAAGVSRANLCDWLGGRSNIRVDTLERIMAALALSVR